VNSRDFLARVGKTSDLSRRSILLLLIYNVLNNRGLLEINSSELKREYVSALVKPPTDLSTLLKSLSKGKNSPLMAGSRRYSYCLTQTGIEEIEEFLSGKDVTEVVEGRFSSYTQPYLEKLISRVSDDNQKKFLSEASACMAVKARRATIIMVWIVTIDHLREYIIQRKLHDFNTALSRRTDKFATTIIRNKDDFMDIPDVVFIEVARSARIITKDVRKILDEKLGIRNTCAHPASVHETKAINFVEDLVDNVIVKYPII